MILSCEIVNVNVNMCVLNRVREYKEYKLYLSYLSGPLSGIKP